MLLSLIAVFTFAMPAVAHAALIGGEDGSNQIQHGACTTTGSSSTDCTNGNPQGSFTDFITKIVNIFSIVVGAVSVIMIIVGGFRYIISGGDSGNVSSAKNTIMYAIIGLIIVLLAQIIVNFVLGIFLRS